MPQLFLLPNALDETAIDTFFGFNAQAINGVKVFFVEEPKSCRKLLKKINPHINFTQCQFYDLNEHTSLQDINRYVSIIAQESAAIVSEAGCPCVADPGAELVFQAHQKNIDIIPLVGPSSILLALMGSGLNGQNFAFNGYLPKDQLQRRARIKILEERSLKENQTQIIMDTPYRNQVFLEDLLNTCKPSTQLCIAASITGPEQFIKTMTVGSWKHNVPDLNKKPALFLILQK